MPHWIGKKSSRAEAVNFFVILPMDALIMLEGVSLLCFEKFEVIFVGLDDVPTGDKKKEFG